MGRSSRSEKDQTQQETRTGTARPRPRPRPRPAGTSETESAVEPEAWAWAWRCRWAWWTRGRGWKNGGGQAGDVRGVDRERRTDGGRYLEVGCRRRVCGEWTGFMHFIPQLSLLKSCWYVYPMQPFSATLFTTGPLGPGPVETEVPSSRAGRDCVEEENEEKRCLRRREGHRAGSSHGTLQVAVFLQMPSPSPASPSHTVTETRNDISVRGELAVGLVEIPWTREHTFSRHGDGSTT